MLLMLERPFVSLLAFFEPSYFKAECVGLHSQPHKKAPCEQGALL